MENAKVVSNKSRRKMVPTILNETDTEIVYDTHSGPITKPKKVRKNDVEVSLPAGLQVTPVASTIMDAFKRKEKPLDIRIFYPRAESRIQRVQVPAIGRKTGQAIVRKDGSPVMVTEETIVKGSPVAALISFLWEGKVYIGWSRRHNGTKKVPIEGSDLVVQRPVEPLSFTRTNAIYIAVVRALQDKIVKVNGKHGPTYMSNGKPIPKDVAKHMERFIERTKTRFERDPCNVV